MSAITTKAQAAYAGDKFPVKGEIIGIFTEVDSQVTNLAGAGAAFAQAAGEIGSGQGVVVFEDGAFSTAQRSEFQGDPGGNVMSVGLFDAVSALNVPTGTDIIQTSGKALQGTGAARYRLVGSGPSNAWTVQSANGRWFALDEAFPDPLMFGALANGSADDTDAVNAAMAYAGVTGDVHLSQQYIVTSLANPGGVRFHGNGRIITAASQGGFVQVNTYVDDGRMWTGKENLYRFLLRIKVGGPLNAFFYGNSTTATEADGGGYAGVQGEPPRLVARMLHRKGVRNACIFRNRAVGGAVIEDMDPIADVDTSGGTTDLMFFKLGINDPIDTFFEKYDALLGDLRASSGFAAVDQLSIVLVMDNATFDPEHGRSSLEQERWRRYCEVLARKHKCFLVDTYSLMRDVDFMATAALGYGYDNPFSDGQGVHPREIPQALMWANVVDAMVGYSDLVLWDNIDPVLVPLASSWVIYSNEGDNYANPRISMNRERLCTFNGGLAAGGTMAAWTQVGSVPAGFEPALNVVLLFPSSDSRRSVRVQIQPNGAIVLMEAVDSNSILAFSGSYYAASSSTFS